MHWLLIEANCSLNPQCQGHRNIWAGLGDSCPTHDPPIPRRSEAGREFTPGGAGGRKSRGVRISPSALPLLLYMKKNPLYTLSRKIKALYLEKGKTESSPQHGAFTDSCLSPITEVQITFIPAWRCFVLSAGELLCLFNSLSRPGYVESLGWRKELAQVIVNSGEQGRAWKHQSLVYVKGESG